MGIGAITPLLIYFTWQSFNVLFCWTAASVGKPLVVFSTFESIIISWNPVISANYTIKIWNNETHIWKDTNCAGSFADDSCVVDNPRAVMTGLTPLSEYYFKVYVNNATSSQPSGPMRTKDYGRADVTILTIFSLLSGSSLVYPIATLLPDMLLLCYAYSQPPPS